LGRSAQALPRRQRFPRSIPSGLQSLHLPALPELSSLRQLPSPGRRQPRPLAECPARQGRPRRLWHALRRLPPNCKSSGRAHAAGKSEMVPSLPGAQNGFCRPLSLAALPPTQGSQTNRRPFLTAAFRTCFNWSSLVFAILQSACTAVIAISGLRVAIGLSALAAAAGIHAPARGFHQDAIRIAMMVLAFLGAVVNLYVIGKVRRLRRNPA